MKKYGIGIVGETKIAKILAKQLQEHEQQGQNLHFVALGVELDSGSEPYKDIKTTANIDELIESDMVDIVVICEEQVMKAYEHARKSLELGKHVVTNHSTMLAAHGQKLWRLADDKNVHLRFEACAMGAVPIFDNLMNHFSAQKINRIYGMLNITCNYALMRMKNKGDNLNVALNDAVELGYAEKDPNMDISGKDSLFKIALLHTAAFGTWVDVGSKKVESLEGLEPVDIQFCQKFSANVKLLASSNGEEVIVAPTLFEEYAQIGNTTGTLSGLVVESENTGAIFFCGHAADKDGISSALASDCLNIAKGQKVWSLKNTVARETEKPGLKRYYIRIAQDDSEKITSANHLHVIDEQHIKNKNGSFVAYIVETGMPKTELSNFLKHSHFKESYYLMNVFKE